MRDFMIVLRKAAEPMWRQEDISAAMLFLYANYETAGTQADGFGDEEAGFDEVERRYRARNSKTEAE